MERFITQENMMLVARILALCFAIPFHEVAHALVSDKLGDHTARNAGRITLNPLRHIDVMGLLSMLLIGVGWAKPVPVDARYYKNRKWGMALTGLAGPVSNLLLAFVTLLIYKVVLYAGGYAANAASSAGLVAVLLVLWYFAIINVSLALFNLLPIPPLDGSRVLGVVLPDRLYFGVMKYERYIMIGLLVAIVVLPYIIGFSPISWLLGPATNAVFGVLDWLTGFVDILFGHG